MYNQCGMDYDSSDSNLLRTVCGGATGMCSNISQADSGNYFFSHLRVTQGGCAVLPFMPSPEGPHSLSIAVAGA
jgi:hypothetical protein